MSQSYGDAFNIYIPFINHMAALNSISHNDNISYAIYPFTQHIPSSW